MRIWFRTISMLFVFVLVLSAVGPASASDAAVQLVPAINESSNVGTGQSTYFVFRDVTVNFNYTGGPVCLSSQEGQCSPPATDDAVRIYVDGMQVYYHESLTQDYGPVDFSDKLHIGSNQVRVQLIDLIGPTRGGSPLWLVSSSISDVQVSVQHDGEFFSPDGKGGSTSVEGQPRANVPIKITVTKDGNPVIAELLQLQPFNAYGGMTDSNGLSTGSLAISIPPQEGNTYIQYQATVDGITATSEPILLYHVGTLYNYETSLTSSDVRSWGDSLFMRYTLDSVINAPDIFNWRGSGNIIDLLITALKIGASYAQYSPQVGDRHITNIYKISAPNLTAVYLLRQAVLRNGNVVLEYNYFSKDLSKVDDVLDDPLTPTHEGLNVVAASPVTFFITNPNGLSSGVDPITGERRFDFPMALADVGEEPYRTFTPGAPNGQYKVQVVGTGDGPYTFSTSALTRDGFATPTLSVTGLTYKNYITTFLIDYHEGVAAPVTLTVVGFGDIKPETLNLSSKSGPNSITAFIELPLGFDISQIDLNSVRLEGVVPAQLLPMSISDYNNNGIPDIMIKFDRKLLVNYLNSSNLFGESVPLTITGDYSQDVQFTVTETIDILKK
jgi:hypothetical protein